MNRKLLSYLMISVVVTLAFGLGNAATAQGYIIDDSLNGYQCVQIGVWDAGTKTCTLTGNITELTVPNNTLVIGSSDITVDGNGHTITGFNYEDNGVTIDSNYEGVTIKNLIIQGYNRGIYVNGGAASGNPNTFVGNSFAKNNVAVYVGASGYNDIIGNNMRCGFGDCVVLSTWSNHNNVRNNYMLDAWIHGINLMSSTDNIITGNTIHTNPSQGHALLISSGSNGNTIYMNNLNGFVDVWDDGTNNKFTLYYLSIPLWGNYWSDYDTPTEACNDLAGSFDGRCDQPHYVPGSSPATDDFAYYLPGGWNRYDFTWYDNVGGRNWILVANPGVSADVWADIFVAGAKKDMPPLAGYASGQIPPGRSVASIFGGLMGGPVHVESRDLQPAVVSQRTLWPAGGNSLEEIPGINGYDLSNTYWWPWYDMQSPGFKNWVAISNPNNFAVYVEMFLGTNTTPVHTAHLAPGAKTTPMLPGVMGGPLKVEGWVDDGYYTKPALLVASQRVLSNGDTAFNEEPGIPAGKLASHYVWTWYDQLSAGAKNWILVANPPTNASQIYYDITIAGTPVVLDGGPIAPGQNQTPTFGGIMAGPVEVRTYYNPADKGGTPADSIASQRIIWGPSFEETPGMDYDGLKSSYAWTWYDQLSAGASNWVLVANPSSSDTIIATVSFVNQANGQGVWLQSGDIAPGGRWTPQFPGKMGGPVKVTAVKKSDSTAAKVITSQRVLWNGHFNEVWGQ